MQSSSNDKIIIKVKRGKNTKKGFISQIYRKETPDDWLLRIGDGENFKRSSNRGIWGIKADNPPGTHFVNNVKPGDRLWFVTTNSYGKLLAVATYRSHNTRELTNKDLGWCDGKEAKSDTELHYSDLYGLNECKLLTRIQSPLVIRKYKENKCKVKLVEEYSYIVRYSKVTLGL